MKSPLLLLGFAVLVLASCSTAYRSGQTPDDVYFSPARERDAYVQVEKQTDRSDYRNYDDEYVNSDDRWLRMRVRNRARWSTFDDYELNNYNSYSYNNWKTYNPYGYSYNNYFNNYWSWNSWYNPYCPRVVVVSPKTNPTAYNKVRNFSLNSYTNNNYTNNRTTNVKPVNRVVLRPTSYSNNPNNQTSNSGSLGTSIRKVFSNQGNSTYSNNNSSARPSRTYTPPETNSSSNNSSRSSSSTPSSSGSSSSGSSGGGGVSRPTRGGN